MLLEIMPWWSFALPDRVTGWISRSYFFEDIRIDANLKNREVEAGGIRLADAEQIGWTCADRPSNHDRENDPSPHKTSRARENAICIA
jgi:hypothetical protein